MSVHQLATGSAILCLLLAILLIVFIVRAIQRKRIWGIIWRGILTLCLLGIVAALVPTIFGLNKPHYFLNHPAPVSNQATVFSVIPSTSSGPGGSGPGGVAAINARDGMLRWQRVLNDRNFQEVIDGDTIYIGTSTPDGKLVEALRGKDGSEVWHALLPGTYSASNMRLAMSNGIIFVALWDTMPPTHEALFAIQAANGIRLWDANIGHGYVSSVRLAIRSDLIYALASSQNGQSTTSILEAFHISDGKVAWWSQEDPSGVYDKLVVGQDVIYIMKLSTLIALDPSNGSPRWQRDYPYESLYIPPVVSGDAFYLCVAQSGGKAMVYDIDESTSLTRWTYLLPESCNFIRAISDTLYITGERNTYVLRLADGSVVRQRHSTFGWTFTASLETAPGVLFIMGGQSVPSDEISLFAPSLEQQFVFAVSASDGSVLWGTPVGPVQKIYPHFVI